MAKQSEAKAKVTLDPSDFQKGAKAVTDAAQAMSSAVTTAFAAAGVAILAFVGAESLKAIGNSALGVITLGEEMANAGKKAGLAAGQFYLFHNAIEKGLSLKTVADLIGDNAQVLNQSANTFRDVALKLWVVGEKIRGFWLGLMDRVAPVLSRLLDGALGISLVQAGEAFGESLANAAKVIYQMLSDGDLWKNVVTVAAASFIYLGNIVSGLVHIAMSEAFAEAWKDFGDYAKTGIEWFSDNFGKGILSAIVTIETSFMDMWIRLIGKVVKATSPLVQLIPGGNAAVDKAVDLASKLNSGAGAAVQSKLDIKPPVFDNKGSVPDQLKALFAGTKFEIPGTEGAVGQRIGDIFKEYLEEFQKTPSFLNNSASQFENNNRQKTFGADSLATIGGGGNVYVGLGILDYTRMSYQELRDMNRKLDLGSLGPRSPYMQFSKGVDSTSISRTQVGNVV